MPAATFLRASSCRTTLRSAAGAVLLGWLWHAAALAQPVPPVPAGNPMSADKLLLGKALFWDEQLSRTGTVACGTCHRPQAAGSDPRVPLAGPTGLHPGPDGVSGNADDIRGSAGVVLHGGDGELLPSPLFGLSPQIGRRKTPSVHDAAFPTRLFWDGRAGDRFLDPDDGTVLIDSGAALENQSLQPLLDSSEMGHTDGTLAGAAQRIAALRPLALASGVPAPLADFIAGRDYPALFQQVFGTSEVTPARIAFALATYQRELNHTEIPFDRELAGIPTLTEQQREGRLQFQRLFCNLCHSDARHTDDSFRYIGVRPVEEDLGRFNVTGRPADRGRMRVPSLRNVALRGPYMHNGGLATLDEVISFYVRGGDFDAPNKDPLVAPLFLNDQERADLLAYLEGALTDPRIAAEQPPFDRPTLYTENAERVPLIFGEGRSGALGVPRIAALEPPLIGSDNFTVSVSGVPAGLDATLVVSDADPGIGSFIPQGSVATLQGTTLAVGNGSAGYLSLQVDLDQATLSPGQVLYGRWYLADAAAPGELAVSRAFRAVLFGGPQAIHASGFE